MAEMALVAQAVYETFHPAKMNYELLGNGDSHIHWHLFPRNPGDSNLPGPVWRLSFAELYAEENRPDAQTLENMVLLLRSRLAALMQA